MGEEGGQNAGGKETRGRRRACGLRATHHPHFSLFFYASARISPSGPATYYRSRLFPLPCPARNPTSLSITPFGYVPFFSPGGRLTSPPLVLASSLSRRAALTSAGPGGGTAGSFCGSARAENVQVVRGVNRSCIHRNMRGAGSRAKGRNMKSPDTHKKKTRRSGAVLGALVWAGSLGLNQSRTGGITVG